jgi:hypothetical protein
MGKARANSCLLMLEAHEAPCSTAYCLLFCTLGHMPLAVGAYDWLHLLGQAGWSGMLNKALMANCMVSVYTFFNFYCMLSWGCCLAVSMRVSDLLSFTPMS